MASQRQLEANRINAKRSTGPKTLRGKVRSRRNAVKHGLTAKELVIPGEDSTAFQTLRQQLIREFKPTTALENELVDDLAGLLWRLRRAAPLEASIIRVRLQEAERTKYNDSERELMERLAGILNNGPKFPMPTLPPDWDEQNREYLASLSLEDQQLYWKFMFVGEAPALEAKIEPGVALIQDGAHSDALGKLSRYEAFLRKAIERSMKLLLQLQADRAVLLELTPSPSSARKESGRRQLRTSKPN